MPRPAPDEDPDLLQAAAHEFGHVIVNLAHGITVISVQVDSRDYSGLTTIEHDDTPAQLRGELIAKLAGFEAEHLWCRRHGGHLDPRTARTDFARFRRHHPDDLPEVLARARARAILIRQWPRIERLAPQLARRGYLTIW